MFISTEFRSYWGSEIVGASAIRPTYCCLSSMRGTGHNSGDLTVKLFVLLAVQILIFGTETMPLDLISIVAKRFHIL